MDLVLQSFSLILLLLIILNMFVETFTNSPILVYKVEMSKQKLYILNDHNFDIKKYIYNINNIVEVTTENSNAENKMRIKDVLEIDINQDKIITVIPEKRYVIFVVLKTKNPIETLQDALNLKKNIVCKPTQIEINMMMFFIKLTQSNYFLMSHNQDLLMELMTGNVVMFFDTLKNIKKIIKDLPNNMFEFVEFEYDINLLKVKYPHIYSENLDMSLLFENYKSRFPVKKILAFDLFITAKEDDIKGFESEVYKVVSNVRIVDINNYYTRSFQYAAPTLQYLQRYNQYIQNRDDLPILEQYIDYTPIGNVQGYYDAKAKTLKLNNDNSIDGVPLENNTFILKNQVRDEENGAYIYESGMLRKKPSLVPTDTGGDSRYRCYGDPSINNKALCNSDIDERGQQKRKITVWDRPCESNDECPFYQANKTYKNYRGGCSDGYCEFPLGIVRTSYRYYDKESKPVCHNCPTENIYCCDQNVNNDYAFELDFDERTAAQNIK